MQISYKGDTPEPASDRGAIYRTIVKKYVLDEHRRPRGGASGIPALLVSYGSAPELSSTSAKFVWTDMEILDWLNALPAQRTPIDAHTARKMAEYVEGNSPAHLAM
jgi:hypothetical protein